MSRKRVSAPMVLAGASAMVAVGIVALMVVQAPQAAEVEHADRAARAETRVDDRTAEAAAESFLDAWRRREWDIAEGLSTGLALGEVQTKRARDDDVVDEDREMAEQVWRQLAASPLQVFFTRSETLEADQRIALHGIAAYELVGHPYRREMSFVVVRQGEVWRVEEMTSGRVLTELPSLLGGE